MNSKKFTPISKIYAYCTSSINSYAVSTGLAHNDANRCQQSNDPFAKFQQNGPLTAQKHFAPCVKVQTQAYPRTLIKSKITPLKESDWNAFKKTLMATPIDASFFTKIPIKAAEKDPGYDSNSCCSDYAQADVTSNLMKIMLSKFEPQNDNNPAQQKLRKGSMMVNLMEDTYKSPNNGPLFGLSKSIRRPEIMSQKGIKRSERKVSSFLDPPALHIPEGDVTAFSKDTTANIRKQEKITLKKEEKATPAKETKKNLLSNSKKKKVVKILKNFYDKTTEGNRKVKKKQSNIQVHKPNEAEFAMKIKAPCTPPSKKTSTFCVPDAPIKMVHDEDDPLFF